MLIETPVPSTFEELLWLGISLTFARAFAEIDYELQGTEWFSGQSKFLQWFVKACLDFFHHWWMGALLIVYSVEVAALVVTRTSIPLSLTIVFWSGWGILLDARASDHGRGLTEAGLQQQGSVEALITVLPDG